MIFLKRQQQRKDFYLDVVAALEVLAEGPRIQGWSKTQGKILTQEVLGENLVSRSKRKSRPKQSQLTRRVQGPDLALQK